VIFALRGPPHGQVSGIEEVKGGPFERALGKHE
jgi:hypothetical protein